MNYETASDDEINKAVQHLKQGKQLWYPLIDYCNNPSDAWPIIVENRISINNYEEDHWEADHTDYIDSVYHINPLRAAMIVFLKMQEAA